MRRYGSAAPGGLIDIGFEGYSIGGLAVGEGHELMLKGH